MQHFCLSVLAQSDKDTFGKLDSLVHLKAAVKYELNLLVFKLYFLMSVFNHHKSNFWFSLLKIILIVGAIKSTEFLGH